MDALLFPGQGSHTPGMRELARQGRPDLLELAERELGVDLCAKAAESTRFAQPAIYCASLAGYELLERPEPAVAAGHSLGEIAALAAAGAISEEDGLRIVVLRGRLMDEAGADGGGMTALRVDTARAETLIEGLDAWVANENAPDQVVVSGSEAALDELERRARAAGVRALRLQVRGAFHSPAMEPAVRPFAEALAAVEVREPRFPVFCSTTAEPFDDVRRRLVEALTRPVRWTAVVRRLDEQGVRTYLETGPGKVLTGLVRRIFPDAAAVSADPMSMSHA
ncbi:MAG: ACP S-malonyltransferase [Thermoleophilaceae bacterium]|nr:ACP S-malonyltransferase [Thermoleophilaceae bacterium]